MAYHLPLDVHPELGNNAQLAAVLGLTVKGQSNAGRCGLLWYGELPKPMSVDDLANHLEARLQRKPLIIAGDAQRQLSRIAWCTGGAQGYLDQAVALG